MLTALRSRDFEKLRPFLAADVDASEVGGLTEVIGPDAFRDAYRLGDPRSNYWGDFERLLTLGGRFQGGGKFCAPYFSCPADDPEEIVILEPAMPVYAKPDVKSPIVATLSCGAVERAAGDELNGLGPYPAWVAIRLPSKQLGFINGDIESHTLFVEFYRIDGRWALGLVAGFD